MVITQYIWALVSVMGQKSGAASRWFQCLDWFGSGAGVLFGSTYILQLMNMPEHLQAMGLTYLQIIALCLLPEAILCVWRQVAGIWLYP